jgi:hypothetical protein
MRDACRRGHVRRTEVAHGGGQQQRGIGARRERDEHRTDLVEASVQGGQPVVEAGSRLRRGD